ncbi:hypothetical protein BDV96DRAFT_287110 [Lophiotrema nucula]|uniref:Uncharacterized protein n=1 Tax=Lophiotrema nucula TaxID=690887 RepID=A0A6A5YNU6_9PLEO|nr:hypothetical protein BDV96DRAFT_287110 [Lophiotrema nucula]
MTTLHVAVLIWMRCFRSQTIHSDQHSAPRGPDSAPMGKWAGRTSALSIETSISYRSSGSARVRLLFSTRILFLWQIALTRIVHCGEPKYSCWVSFISLPLAGTTAARVRK